MEEEKKSVELSITNEDKSMGSYLNLWSSYMESENAMLLR